MKYTRRTKACTEKRQLAVSELLKSMKDNSLVVQQITNGRVVTTENRLHIDRGGNGKPLQ